MTNKNQRSNLKLTSRKNKGSVFTSIKSQGATVRVLSTGYFNVVIAGTTNGTVVPNSYVTSTTSWSQYASDYTQFRVLAARLQYVPFFGRSLAAGAGAGVAAAYNGGLSSAIPSAPASPPDVTAYHDDFHFVYTGKPFTLLWKPVSVVQRQLCSTGTPATIGAFGGFLIRFEGCTAGTVGYFYLQYVLEFTRS